MSDLDDRMSHPDLLEPGNPDDIGYYPGEKIRRVNEDNSTRRSNYPRDEDIDYDPRMDEDLEDLREE